MKQTKALLYGVAPLSHCLLSAKKRVQTVRTRNHQVGWTTKWIDLTVWSKDSIGAMEA